MTDAWIWFSGSWAATLFLTWWVRNYVVSQGRLDVPNARSSHSLPTPRGGGLAIVAVSIAGLALLGYLGALSAAKLIACGVGGAVVAGIGYVDDARGLGARVRFCVHMAAAGLAAYFLLGEADAQPLFSGLPGAVALGVAVLAIVWSVNLFNFMDGIDGIAAWQSAFVSGAAALLAILNEGHPGWIVLAALTAGANLGFLPWNWPKARIFLGDVGSGFLGFWLAVLAIGLHTSGSLNVWASIALSAVFLADATVTLLRRVVRGERWYEAHRVHAYQILARRWRSHVKVTGLVLAINICLVFPAACASMLWPPAAPTLALCTILVLALACLLIGAGGPSEVQ